MDDVLRRWRERKRWRNDGCNETRQTGMSQYNKQHLFERMSVVVVELLHGMLSVQVYQNFSDLRHRCRSTSCSLQVLKVRHHGMQATPSPTPVRCPVIGFSHSEPRGRGGICRCNASWHPRHKARIYEYLSHGDQATKLKIPRTTKRKDDHDVMRQVQEPERWDRDGPGKLQSRREVTRADA